MSTDICMIGFWDVNGIYTPSEDEFRSKISSDEIF